MKSPNKKQPIKQTNQHKKGLKHICNELQPDKFLGCSSERTHIPYWLEINKYAVLHFPAANF